MIWWRFCSLFRFVRLFTLNIRHRNIDTFCFWDTGKSCYFWCFAQWTSSLYRSRALSRRFHYPLRLMPTHFCRATAIQTNRIFTHAILILDHRMNGMQSTTFLSLPYRSVGRPAKRMETTTNVKIGNQRYGFKLGIGFRVWNFSVLLSSLIHSST